MVRLPAAPKLIFLLLLPLRGRGPHFRFGVPANHLASLSLSPSGVRRPEVTKCQHLLIPHCDLHSSLTVTF